MCPFGVEWGGGRERIKITRMIRSLYQNVTTTKCVKSLYFLLKIENRPVKKLVVLEEVTACCRPRHRA